MDVTKTDFNIVSNYALTLAVTTWRQLAPGSGSGSGQLPSSLAGGGGHDEL